MKQTPEEIEAEEKQKTITEIEQNIENIPDFYNNPPDGGKIALYATAVWEATNLQAAKEISETLINRSKEALLTLAMEISSDSDGEENDLMAVSSVDMSLALELNQKGIKTRDDLAELSVEELTDIIKIEEKNIEVDNSNFRK